MKALRRLLARLADRPAAPHDPTSGLSDAELLDRLISRTGFDPDHPSWTDGLRALHRHSRARRLQILPDFFYTSALAPADLPPIVWEGTFPACGDFDFERQKRFLEATPAFPDDMKAIPLAAVPGRDADFFWGNEQFSHADAALYYALIRRFRPRRIVEVGSGHSTKLALRALRDNGSGEILCIEPHPPAWLASLEGPIAIRRELVQSTPEAVFLDLAPSDILFIDDSHISKTGSDVNHLFLRVLPRLPAGVLVQIHDICLPYEYIRSWSEDHLCYWNEQYVLAALLANSAKFEILAGTHFLYRQDPEVLRPFMPGHPGIEPAGGSLWLRSREAS